MQALDAGLAFAITMLILSMVVTTMVETLHRVFGLREKGLALLLGNFYDRIFVPRSGGALGGTEDRRAFIEMMTVNRGPVGRAPMTAIDRSLIVDATSQDRKFLNWIWSGRRLGSLGLTTFMERLGSSAYGAHIVTQASAAGDKGVEWVLKDIAQKFDAFGVEASEYFESRARLLSVIVGFVLAFAINVNALALFDAFMKRPDVTQAVIARAEGVTQSYQKLQAQADGLNASAARAQTAVAGQAPAAADNAALQREMEESRASLRRAADEASAAVKSLQSVGVPIGWNAQSAADFRQSTATSLLGLLLGGLLIGLGAPFWYRTVQTLTGTRSASRGAKESVESPATSPATPAPNHMPNTPIDAFHAALGATLATGALVPPEEAVG